MEVTSNSLNVAEVKANIAKYRESVRKAEAWLTDQLNADGTMNPVEKGALSYYKVPRGFQVIGRLTEANAMLDWAQRDIFTDEGDFASDRKAFHFHHYTYSSAWYVWVAQLMARFDVSYKGMDYLLRFRNPNTGGYCAEATYSSENHNEQDFLTTAFISFVGLHLGLVDEAQGAAKFLIGLLDQQPDPEEAIWLRGDNNGKLVTEVSEACDEPRFYVLRVKEPAQYYYYLGATMIFLTKLYNVTGEKAYLDGAERVYKICHNCHDDVFNTDGTGKVGLGSAFLFRTTGEAHYAESAMRSCDFLVSDQDSEGPWIRGGKPTASSTAEFVVWQWEVISILSNALGVAKNESS
jgi:hypothetical protein